MQAFAALWPAPLAGIEKQKNVRFILQQGSDLVVYLLVPLCACLLPARWSRSLVARVSRWSWLMAPRCELAWAQASEHTRIADERAWKTRWRQVELLDARDLYLLVLGRKATVLAEIDGAEAIETARGKVLVGMHWGPSISILRLLAVRGMQPTLLYRNVEPALLRKRPFHYLFLRLAVHEIRTSCGGRAIAVKGAMAKLRERLAADGTDIVVLDAPPLSGRSVIEGQVLGRRALFNAGFPDLLSESGKQYLLFAISLDPQGRLTKRLELSAPQRVGCRDAFMDSYCRHLSRHLETDSSHWRIWQVAQQFFPVDAAPPDEAATEPAAEAPGPPLYPKPGG